MKRWAVVVVATVVCLPVMDKPAVAAGKFKYGEWEIAIELQGFPIAMPSQTQRVCLQHDTLAPGTRQVHGCKAKWTLHGNTANWTFQCSNGGHGKGLATYQWDTLKGYNELIMPGGLLSLQSTLTGKWVATRCSAQSLR